VSPPATLAHEPSARRADPCFSPSSSPVKQYLQLSLKNLGFSTVMANLLAVPNTVISVVMLLAITMLSEVVNNRAFVASLQAVWQLPNYIALEALPTIAPWQVSTGHSSANSRQWTDRFAVISSTLASRLSCLVSRGRTRCRSPGSLATPAPSALVPFRLHSTT
jgi:hypothetical protein